MTLLDSETRADVSVRINNCPPVDGVLCVEKFVEVVTSLGPTLDPGWSFVDAVGHFHAHSETDEFKPYPTLTEMSRHHDCDGADHVDAWSDDDQSAACEGWNETYYVCRICGEEVKPGTIPGPHEHYLSRPSEWCVEVTTAITEPAASVLAGSSGGTVSVRATVPGAEWEYFGVALTTNWRYDARADSSARTTATLQGVGPLGRRKVAA